MKKKMLMDFLIHFNTILIVYLQVVTYLGANIYKIILVKKMLISGSKAH